MVTGQFDPATRHTQRDRARDFDVLIGHHSGLRHPTIHGVFRPIFIGEDGQTVATPALSPRVLQNKSCTRIANNNKRVASIRRCRSGHRDRPVPALRCFGIVALQPSGMANRAGVENSYLVQSHMHVSNRACVYPVISAQRALCCIQPPIILRALGSGRHSKLFPQFHAASAVLVPALHRTAQTRACIFFISRKFVVASRHRVEHIG